MDRKIVYDKILGSMVCCALGDAMGAVTENLSFDQIRDKYPGGVRELIAPGQDGLCLWQYAGTDYR